MPRDRLLLAEMVDATQRITALVARLDPEDPSADRDLLDALLWNYTVLGEAARQLSDELKTAHPEVPWSDPVRLRDRIVHGYWSVDVDILVSTARDDLPGMLEALRRIEEGA